MITDDIKAMQREVLALKGFTTPTARLYQHTLTVKASQSVRASSLVADTLTIQFVDGKPHMAWVSVVSTNTRLMDFSLNNGVITQNLLRDAASDASVVVSAYFDFKVSS